MTAKPRHFDNGLSHGAKPWSRAVGSRRRWVTAFSERRATGMEAKRRRRVAVAVWEGNPLKSESWKRLRGEINSQGRSWIKPSEVGGTPWTEGVGSWKARRSNDTAYWCREEDAQTPRKVHQSRSGLSVGDVRCGAEMEALWRGGKFMRGWNCLGN